MSSLSRRIRGFARRNLPYSVVELARLRRLTREELVARVKLAFYVFKTGNNGNLKVDRHGRFDVAYRSNSADEKVIQHSFDKDIFFSSIPEYCRSSNDVILDVGAHIGTFTILAAVDVAKVYAIEACRETFDFLRINIRLNALDNVTVSHVALAGKSGKVTLHHDEGAGNWGHSIMVPLSQSTEEVDALSLADFMNKYAISKVDLAKFNCEGAEFPVILNSDRDTLLKIEAMLILYHCDLALGRSLEELLSKLAASDFSTRVFNRSPDGMRGWIFARRG